MEHIFYAEEYHQHIPLSFPDKQGGKVHSTFANGLNISFGDRLLFIGTKKNGQLPFGIHLQMDALKQLLALIRKQESFVWDATKQQLHGVTAPVIVSLQNATPFTNELPHIPVHFILASFPTILSVVMEEGEQTGLDIVAESFLWEYAQQIDPQTEVEQKMRYLLAHISSKNRQEIVSVLRYFIGRGKGLTPSGDDTFVGLLAVHHAANICSPSFLALLTELVEKERLTTDVGREYLRYALKGNFSSTIVDIMNDIKEENTTMLALHLRELLSMGHHSGLDTAFGMLVGILALKASSPTA